MTIIIEFYEGNKKVAECPAAEVFALPKEKAANFWDVQDRRNRAIMLRMDGEERGQVK